ncbi:SRPBCC family protein [Algisphaera agarilytica]|uniref:Uncharacterized protein YndB with AHSA1/START domain n=1 Tax=Algisphaera agarilytica TaxID=1385975 RepID=A0A7X0H6A7_9BACT|nr:SRPBCC domain-containing protein [Algisphaera agarilytica]MBB6430106.1 uncharacterized protein YndB with AHSA1/START domain [Algisphaera agarilytica]
MTSSPTQPSAMIRLHKHVQASPARVFEALTTAEQYTHWFAPDPNVTCGEVLIEPRVGGRFRFEMVTPDGSKHVGVGTFTEVIENQKISYTWSWESQPDFGANSQVTWELFETENHYAPGEPATEIVLTHDKLHTSAERSEHTGGWWQCLRALGYHVRGVDPREAIYGKPAANAS